jgi:hypothetical protein
MTAANLGVRVTGWGFAVFALGAVAWILVGAGTGQRNLLLSNAFLLIVDIVGVWRWLGRQARYETGADHAAVRSAAAPAPTLFPLSKLPGSALRGREGETIATVVDAMARCDDGGIAYVVVREGGVGGVGERLHALGWSRIRLTEETVEADIARADLAALPALTPERWPASPKAADVG